MAWRRRDRPIQCSEKISFAVVWNVSHLVSLGVRARRRLTLQTTFAVSHWTNDFSHTWKTSFALLIGQNLFPYENLRHNFLVNQKYRKISVTIIAPTDASVRSFSSVPCSQEASNNCHIQERVISGLYFPKISSPRRGGTLIFFFFFLHPARSLRRITALWKASWSSILNYYNM